MLKRNKKTKPTQITTMDEMNDLAADGPVLVDFFQKGCSPCQAMDGIVKEIADEFSGGLAVAKVNVAHAPELVQRFKVMSTPTFVVLASAKNAKTVSLHQRWKGTGLIKKDALVKVVTDAGATPPST
ncbi:MAG: thioredoxin family protein [Acidimicrobiia bacterium]|nr:thioredoxin family protein [Acidimicrobiia bacterium]MDH5503987.1 thioredoxin family protein [Acidimicrobiia bacterium]